LAQSASAAQDVRTLVPGQLIERELAGSETHSYQITLSAGQYLRVVVEQRGADLAAEVRGPDGQQVVECDSHWDGPEPVCWVAAVAGDYKMTVRLAERLTIPAGYGLKVDTPRPSAPADEKRVLAESTSAEAKRLLLRATAESRAAAIRRYEAALALWRGLGDRAEEAQTLTSLGYLYRETRELPKAMECLQQALAIRRSLGDVAGEAQTLHNLAVAQVSPAEKRKYYELALERRRAAADRRGEAQTLAGLCALTLSAAKGIECFDQALGLARGAGDPLTEAQALNGLGFTNIVVGKRGQAISYFQQALRLFRETGNRDGQAAALNNLGKIHADTGDLRKALECYEQVVPLVSDLGDHRVESALFINLGSLHARVGKPSMAVEYLTRALSLVRAMHDDNNETYVLNNLGQLYADLGERQKALDCFDRSLALGRTNRNRSLEAASLNNLGNVYHDLGELQKALDCHVRARQIFQELSERQNEAYTVANIGMIHITLGDAREALNYFHQARALRQGGGDRRGEGYTLNYMGQAHHLLNEDRQSLDYLRQALEIARDIGDGQNEAYALTHLGVAHAALGDKPQAREFYGQALRRWRDLLNRQREATTLVNLAAVERELGELDEARAHIEAALGLIETLRTKVASQDLRASYFASAQDGYHICIDLLMKMEQQRAARGFAAAALEVSERARARSLLELLTEAKVEIEQGIAPDLKQRERDNQARLSLHNSQLIQARSRPPYDQKRVELLTAELKQDESEREQLESEIRRNNPKYAEIYYPAPLRLGAIQSLLDEQTALLEYSLGRESSFLFVVTREGMQSYLLPKAAEIEPLIQVLRAALERPERGKFGHYVQAARQLYEILIAPAAPTLALNRRLIVVPDGRLHYLPFEALLTQEAKTRGRADYRALSYLLKRWTVSYAPSASVLATLRQSHQREATPPLPEPALQLVAFGDPVYEPSSDKPANQSASKMRLRQMLEGCSEKTGQWAPPRLVDSRREVEAIARLYPAAETALYLGQAASEESVKTNQQLSRARRIHFATHGLINECQPQNSALVLTMDDDPREDGLLHTYEIFNLKLSAELVVLSACQTGLGQQVRGEGVIGLTRAFLYAGASGVVVSLWQVADRSTADSMIQFHRQLNRGADKAEALRGAKLEMIGSGPYAHPYYWAPFVLTGAR